MTPAPISPTTVVAVQPSFNPEQPLVDTQTVLSSDGGRLKGLVNRARQFAGNVVGRLRSPEGKGPEKKRDPEGKSLFISPEFFEGTLLTQEKVNKMGGPLAALKFVLGSEVTVIHLPVEGKKRKVEILMGDHPHYLPTIQRLARLLADKAMIEGGEENQQAYEEAKRLLVAAGYDTEGNPVHEDRTPTLTPPGGIAAVAEIPPPKIARVQFVGTGVAPTYAFDITEGNSEAVVMLSFVAHDCLFFHDGFVFLMDGGHRSSTSINGEKIPPHLEIPLAEGDRVQIGEQEFIVSDTDSLAAIEDLEVSAEAIPHLRLQILHVGIGEKQDEVAVTLDAQGKIYHPFGVEGLTIYYWPQDTEMEPQGIRMEQGVYLLDERRKEDLALEAMDARGMPVCLGLSLQNSPLDLNGRRLPVGRPTRLQEGDEIATTLRTAFVHLPREAVGKMAAMPKWRQRVIAAQIAKATNDGELAVALSRAAEMGSNPISDRVGEILSGNLKFSVFTLPVEWGIREKVLEIMRRELEERRRQNQIPFKEVIFKSEWLVGIRIKLEEEYAAAVWAEEMETLLAEASSLEEMATLLRQSPFAFLDGINLDAVAARLEEYELVGEMSPDSFPEIFGIRAKAKELAPAGISTLRLEIETAKDLPELVAILRKTKLSTLGGQRLEKLIEALSLIADSKGNGIQNLPRTVGLRQKVRDLVECRDFVKGTSRDPEATTRLLPSQIAELDIDQEKLLDEAGKKWREKVYLVLERGKPLAWVTQDEGLREKVVAHMWRTVAVAKALGWTQPLMQSNPFTGERVDSDNIETLYRLAKVMINTRLNRPTHGIPTKTETDSLLQMINTTFKTEAKNYLEAQQVWRSRVDALDARAVPLLKLAPPSERALLLESYFGNFQHRDMPSLERAFRVATLFGFSGLYREIGVTLSIENGKFYANVSLGDMGSVSPEDRGRFFVLHTHPTDYRDKEGKVMGRKRDGGFRGSGEDAKTVALDAAMSLDPASYSILFSDQDVSLYVRDAKNYARISEQMEMGATLLYDPKTGIYKNWVFNLYGASEANVVMENGEAKKVVIFFAINPKYKDSTNDDYKEAVRRLRKYVKEKLRLEVEIQEIPYKEFEKRLPFPVN